MYMVTAGLCAVAAGFAFAPEDTDSTKVDAEVKW